ncbi:cytochrome D1, partial [Pseudomonas laurentiana]|nr:cytochrome D1 [Pseudomonas laurentiana]
MDLDGAHRLSRDGITVEFEARPLGAAGALSEGGFASVRFKVTEQNTGQPLSGMSPGAWIDPARAGEVASERDKSCKARVGLFLKSSIGARPLLDLNSYFLLVLNKDASLTVIDPSVSVGGVTSTLARIELPQPPMDWVASADDKRVFVTLPGADQVALVNTETFQLAGLLAAGKQPVRIAMQPDQRLLWVGNNAVDVRHSGVTVIDGQTHKTLKFIPTGAGTTNRLQPGLALRLC